MKTKRKGFTLIELIVVIAIIGVLCAILIPAMMGYVRRSKITSSNSAARSLSNAMNIAIVDMDSMDLDVSSIISSTTNRYMDYFPGENGISGKNIYDSYNDSVFDIQTELASSTPDLLGIFYCKVIKGFSDIEKIDRFSFRLMPVGCEGVGVMRGNIPGSYPIAIGVDDYEANPNWNTKKALGFGVKDATLQ